MNAPATTDRSAAAANGAPAVLDEAPRQPAPLVPPQPVERQRLPRTARSAWAWSAWLMRTAGSACEWSFGLATIVGALAVLATLPVLQLLSLGYLLEVAGRIARQDSLRAGLVGVRRAARVGGVVLGVWLVFWPLRLVSEMAASAQLIDPGGPVALRWQRGLLVLGIATVCHVSGALLRGGRWRSFLWPRPVLLLRQALRPATYRQARDALWTFTIGLRLPYYFWLGLRGFVGAAAWLAGPVSLLALAPRLPGGAGVLTGFVGGALLAIVLVHLPFLQTRFAAENRLRAMFELGAVRAAFARAPLVFVIAVLFTLALALPLYLLKIEIVPREAAWLPSLLFVLSIWPARMIAGWAYARSQRQSARRHWRVRWASRLALVPVVAFYVLVVFFTQYLSWHGVWSLYEQHAFLVPVPFLGL